MKVENGELKFIRSHLKTLQDTSFSICILKRMREKARGKLSKKFKLIIQRLIQL